MLKTWPLQAFIVLLLGWRKEVPCESQNLKSREGFFRQAKICSNIQMFRVKGIPSVQKLPRSFQNVLAKNKTSYFNHKMAQWLIVGSCLKQTTAVYRDLTSEFTLCKKWSFPLRISWVNVTKSSKNCGFGHTYWRNPQWKLPFSCSVI